MAAGTGSNTGLGRMSKRITAMILVAALVALAWWGWSWLEGEIIDRRTPPAPEVWLGYDFRTERAALSTQAEAPFLFGGQILDRDHPAWDRYGEAIERRPDTLSCLRPSERDAEQPNLLAFDWHRVRGYDRYVCLFRVATTLGSIERIRAWMGGSGMRIERVWSPSADRIDVSGSWTLDEMRQRPDEPLFSVFRGLQVFLQWLTRRNYPDYDWRNVYVISLDQQGRVRNIASTAW